MKGIELTSAMDMTLISANAICPMPRLESFSSLEWAEYIAHDIIVEAEVHARRTGAKNFNYCLTRNSNSPSFSSVYIPRTWIIFQRQQSIGPDYEDKNMFWDEIRQTLRCVLTRPQYDYIVQDMMYPPSDHCFSLQWWKK